MTEPVKRREALKVLAALPAAGVVALAPLSATVERANRWADFLAAGGPALAPRFFTAHEWATVRLLVDYIIPRDARSGSATDAKVPEYMDYLFAEHSARDQDRVEMRGGLVWLDEESRRRFDTTFVGGTDAQRRGLLDDIAYPDRTPRPLQPGAAFFTNFRDTTASGFFSSAMGWQDLRYVGNTFVPHWDGCPPAALDKLGVSYDVMKTRVPPE
jgi:gluconate 2-dehydrogenase gamma chain